MEKAYLIVWSWWWALAALTGLAVYYLRLSASRKPWQLRFWPVDPVAVSVVAIGLAGLASSMFWVQTYQAWSAAVASAAPVEPVSLAWVVTFLHLEHLAIFYALALVPGLIAGLLLALVRIGTSKAMEPPREIVEGPRILDGTKLQRAAAKKRKKGAHIITFAGVEVEPKDEMRHFLTIGGTGSGKSVAIRDILDGARARGDRAIIADNGGGYLARYYRPGDIILNPLDARAHAWDLLREAKQDYHVDNLAAALFPTQGGANDNAWTDRARTLLSSVLEVLRREEGATVADVFRLTAQAPREELAVLLADTPAVMFLNGEKSTVFDNLRASCSAGMRALRRAAEMTGEPFSIREWATGNSKAWIFLNYQDDQKQTLDSLIGAMMSLAISSTMSRPEGNFPTWFVADELDGIGKLDDIDNAVVRLRKYGGRCVLGFQTIQKIRADYGEGPAQAMFENCKTRLFLQCAGSDQRGTAFWASEQIGKVTYWKYSSSTGKSKGQGRSGQHSGESANESRSLSLPEPAVLPSAIETLPDFGSGYFRRPSDKDWYRISYEYDAGRQQVVPPFVPRS